MQVQHELAIPVDASIVFSALTDLECVAACLPGARLTWRDTGAVLHARTGTPATRAVSCIAGVLVGFVLGWLTRGVRG